MIQKINSALLEMQGSLLARSLYPAGNDRVGTAEQRAFDLWEEILSERRGGKVEILTPRRGQKRALLDLGGRKARHAFERRFRDLHTLLAQGQAHLSNFESAGQALFGIEPAQRL